MTLFQQCYCTHLRAAGQLLVRCTAAILRATGCSMLNLNLVADSCTRTVPLLINEGSFQKRQQPPLPRR
jgi:hypothetical protein